MYVARAASAMWQTKWACLLLLVLSIVAALVLTFNVSLRNGDLHPRGLTFGVAQTQLLVDSGKSPIADGAVLTEDVDTLAGDFAELMPSATVLRPAARAMGVSPRDISAQSQLVGEVAQDSTDAEEAQRGTQLLDAGRDYSILARVDQSSFVVQIFTQAPTAQAAVKLADVSAHALQQWVARTVSQERIRRSRSVILRQVQPAYGGTVDKSLPKEAAALLALMFFALSTTGWLAIRRWRTRLAASVA